MRKIIVLSVLVVLDFNLSAQNTIDNVLAEVEKNNTTLSAYRKNTDAELIGNKTGLTPQNPEVEFNYLWGNPSVIGNRTDFCVTQSFDFPTAYSYKNQISDLKNEQAELEYKRKRIEVLHQARLACVKLTYYNALKIEIGKSYANAQQIADAYKIMYEAGEIGILEYNQAQVNFLNVSKEQENNEIERSSLLLELSALNGGNSISFSDSLFSQQTIPAEFDQWYLQAEANNPLLQWVKQEIAISSKEIQLNKAMGLPKFYGGYMSEKTVGEQFQGVTVGITIPLWENKNTVYYAKAKSLAMQRVEADAKLQFYNSMKVTHAKVIALQNSVVDYRSKLALYSNSDLLKEAFEKGEISLTAYLYETSFYYESIFEMLEMEMDMNIAFSELIKYH